MAWDDIKSNGQTLTGPEYNAMVADQKARIHSNQKGAALGVATLDANGKVPASQLNNVEGMVIHGNGIGIIPKTVRFDGILAPGNAQQFSALEVDATLQSAHLVLRGSLPVGQSIKVQITKNGAAPTDSVLVADVPIELIPTATVLPNGLAVVEGSLDLGMVACNAYDWFQATIVQVGTTYAGNDLDVQLVFG